MNARPDERAEKSSLIARGELMKRNKNECDDETFQCGGGGGVIVVVRARFATETEIPVTVIPRKVPSSYPLYM